MHSEANARLEAALYVVATPLGNLRDVTLRALDVLAAVDIVAAEDTRFSRQLLARHGINASLLALHEHNESAAAAEVVRLIEEGKAVAYVTDAGTPAISDPGALLVSTVWKSGQKVVPIPGPSAVIAALSAAGGEPSPFLFYGFLPSKSNGRRQALSALATLPYRLVFYEAPHRISETLQDMQATLGAERGLTIARELTKMFESFFHGRLAEAQAWLDGDVHRVKGEFVLIVQGAAPERSIVDDDLRQMLVVLLEELPLKQAVQVAVRLSGSKKNELYALALELKNPDTDAD